MKKTILAIAAICITTFASAQITFNVKGGFGISSFYGAEKMSMTSFDKETEISWQVKTAWRIGVGMEYAFNESWAITPSLNFINVGAETEEYTVAIGSNSLKYKGTVNLNYIQIPINAQWKTAIGENTNLSIYAGPYLAFGIGGKSKDETTTTIYGVTQTQTTKLDSFGDGEGEIGFKTFDFGLNYGINLEFSKHYLVGLNMDLGLLENQKNFKGKNIGAALVVGYRF